MANSFGGSVKLTGENEYRNALKNITSDLKLMSQQMTAVSGVYSKNGNDINALTEKDRILSKEVELQASKIITLNGMLDDNVKKYGEDSSQVSTLKEKINLAHIELDKMNINLEENSKNLEQARKNNQEYDSQNKTSINSVKDFTAELLKTMAGASNLGQTLKDDLSVRVNDLKTNITNSKEKVKDFATQVADTVQHPEKLGNVIKSKLIDTADKLQSSVKEDAEAIEEISESADKSSDSSLKLGDIIKANLISDAIVGGLKSLGSAIKSCASSFSEWATMSNELQEQEKKVQTVLNNTTDATEEQIQAYIDLTAEKEKAGVISQEAILSGAQELGTYVEQIDTLETLTDTMLDMTAQQYGVNASMEQCTGIATTLGKALANGDYSGLTRLGYGFDEVQEKIMETGTEAERAQVIMDVVGASVGGMNEALAMTNAGKVQLVTSYIDDMKKSVGSLYSDMKNGLIADFLPQIQEVSNALTGMISGDVSIEEGMQQIVDAIQLGLENITAKMPEFLSKGAEILTQLMNGIVSSIPSLMPIITQVINTLISTIVSLLPQLLQAGVQIIVSLVQGIGQSLPTLIPQMIDAVLTMVDTLLDNIDLIIDAGIELILGLAEGLINALPDLIDKIPIIIDKLITAITNNLPKLIEMGITLTVKLAEGLIKAIPQLISKIPQIITSLVSGISNYFSNMLDIGKELLGKVKDGIVSGISGMADVGKNLVQGLWNGINNAKDWVLDKIKGFGSSILSGIKSIFGIHSPSTVFRDEIGSNLAKGIGVGFEEEMDDVNKSIQGALPTDLDLGTNLNLNNNLSDLSHNGSDSYYSNLIDAFKDALDGMAFKVDGDKIGELIVSDVERVIYS
jgi:phage-related protein